ncbi:MAG: hypothetical protein R8K47_08510 [Mariprofundaceae bacterium]
MASGNLFGWSDAVWLLLDQIGILASDVLMALSVVAAVAGWLNRDEIRRWLRRNAFPDVGGEFDARERRWDGLVFTVSHEGVPQWVMAKIRPHAVAFICSNQSRDTAGRLADKAKSMGIRSLAMHEVDEHDPDDALRAARSAIAALREADCEHIAIDVTGGKLPMSIGAFMAAEEAGVDTLYVASSFDSKLKRPDMSTARILRISGGH